MELWRNGGIELEMFFSLNSEFNCNWDAVCSMQYVVMPDALYSPEWYTTQQPSIQSTVCLFSIYSVFNYSRVTIINNIT